MSVGRYAVVRDDDGLVDNVILWDPVDAPDWTPVDGCTVYLLGEADAQVGPGFTRAPDGTYVEPEPEPEPES